MSWPRSIPLWSPALANVVTLAVVAEAAAAEWDAVIDGDLGDPREEDQAQERWRKATEALVLEALALGVDANLLFRQAPETPQIPAEAKPFKPNAAGLARMFEAAAVTPLLTDAESDAWVVHAAAHWRRFAPEWAEGDDCDPDWEALFRDWCVAAGLDAAAYRFSSEDPPNMEARHV